MWTKTATGSIYNDENEPVFLSIDDFKSKICFGNGCFVCGRMKKESGPFNDEHVFPKWLLKKYDLYDETLTLPNGKEAKYSTYKIRCCASCNSDLGEHYETPISRLIDQIAVEGIESLEAGERFLVYKWIGLIYLKVHLRDRFNKLDLHDRKNTSVIAEHFNWSDFHHIHQVVFSELRDTKVHPSVRGTFFALRCSEVYFTEGDFDYLDLHLGSAVMMKIGGIALFAILDDCGLCKSFLEKSLSRITSQINRFQCIEILSTLACVRCSLWPQPVFSTFTDRRNKSSEIVCEVPTRIELENLDSKIRGNFMMTLMRPHLSGMPDEVKQSIEQGELSFLFDLDGQLLDAQA